MSDEQQQPTRNWDTEAKLELANLIRDRTIDPYNHTSEYVKEVVHKNHFWDQVLKNFYPNYCRFVKKFILGKKKDGAMRQAAEEGMLFFNVY